MYMRVLAEKEQKTFMSNLLLPLIVILSVHHHFATLHPWVHWNEKFPPPFAFEYAVDTADFFCLSLSVSLYSLLSLLSLSLFLLLDFSSADEANPKAANLLPVHGQ
jgi:hypothetical protein